MTGQVTRYLRTGELYQKVLDLVFATCCTDDINPDDIRRALDAVLTQGKIEGRMSVMAAPLSPQAGQTWSRRDNPDDVVEIETVSVSVADATFHVLYRHRDPEQCPCGQPMGGFHARRGHRSRATVEDFTRMYVWDRADGDRLIEGWQRIVDGA